MPNAKNPQLRSAIRDPRSSQRGFTLLESLIALAILAIALTAVLRATSAGTSHVDALRQRLLADWVAQNRIALHTGRGDWLPVGSQQGEETQGGLKFIWQETISSTPNHAFRRIEVSVASGEEPQHALRHLNGYLVEFPRR
ncbi:MAG: type II secretion system minor pseudopilin GspI [Gallionella sp.]|jgi:general secretion pathway protein I